MFSEEYRGTPASRYAARETPPEQMPEALLQRIWRERLYRGEDLHAHDGRRLKVLSPGWWNRSEGPDFTGAQIEFNGRLFAGDIEIHTTHGDWTRHGHHRDARYDDVFLVVVLEDGAPAHPPVTSNGKRIPTLSLSPYLDRGVSVGANPAARDEEPFRAFPDGGRCRLSAGERGLEKILNLICLAGQWRMVQKAGVLGERMRAAGPDQAVYELYLAACGYSHFKHHFKAIAGQFHYDRVRQLARQDPLVLEAAFLQLGGLLPDSLPPDGSSAPHLARLRQLRQDFLPGLKPLPLEWHRGGVRPMNYPERRLAAAAAFLSHTARHGLAGTLEELWQSDLPPVARRRTFEALFSKNMGFWSRHCTWWGRTTSRSTAPMGAGRIRSIIGNVFVPVGLALARQARNRRMEEAVLDFFLRLPAEPDNRMTRDMALRLLGPDTHIRMTFSTQQGMLQIRQDWCETNPSCRNCSILSFLDQHNHPAWG